MHIGPGLVIFFHLIIGNSTAYIGPGKFWIYFNGLGVIKDSLGKIILIVVGNPTGVISLCIFRIKFNRLTEIRNSLIIITLFTIGNSKTVIGRREVWIYLNGLIII